MITYTFIIPHKNSPKLLDRCIDSIPQREDIEIIIVDDNSDLDKQPLIKRRDCKIVYVPAKESKGAGHARNIGLELAQGKWLLFADCDDYYTEGFITILDQYSNLNLDILYFDANIYSNSSFRAKAFHKFLSSSKSEFDKNLMALSSNEPWSKMFNCSFVKSIGAKFEEIPRANDAWFVAYTGINAKKVEVCFSKIYNYINNPNGISNSVRPLEHYYMVIDSTSRINLLKARHNLWQLIVIPTFKNVRRDYGIWAFLKIYFYKITHDFTFFPFLLRRLFMRRT